VLLAVLRSRSTLKVCRNLASQAKGFHVMSIITAARFLDMLWVPQFSKPVHYRQICVHWSKARTPYLLEIRDLIPAVLTGTRILSLDLSHFLLLAVSYVLDDLRECKARGYFKYS
jgi:hypothetical protein